MQLGQTLGTELSHFPGLWNSALLSQQDSSAEDTTVGQENFNCRSTEKQQHLEKRVIRERVEPRAGVGHPPLPLETLKEGQSS